MDRNTDTTKKTPISLLGLGAMGTALAHAWLATGHPLTVWNRTPDRADPLAAAGATVVATAAEAVAASDLVVVCLLDDDSVGEVLAHTDLTGKDVVNLTTNTPAEARARAEWARERGARFLDGGVMAVPPMIGIARSGAYVFYSGAESLFGTHQDALAVPAGTVYVGENPGHAALHDVALLSAMYGMLSGISHAFALTREGGVDPRNLATLLVDWLTAMASSAQETAEQLASGDYTRGVVSTLAMQVAGQSTLLRTAEEQGVSAELLTPYMDLMRRRLADGHGEENTAGLVDVLRGG